MPFARTDERGLDAYPSPRLWKDCKGSQLNEQGLGFFRHETFNGGFATRLLSGPTITLPDPTDAPADADTLRDDLVAVWIPAIEAAFVTAGWPVALTDPTDTPASAAALALNINSVLIPEIVAQFNAVGQGAYGSSITPLPAAPASADAIRETIVATTNPEIEAMFLDLYANQGFSIPNFEMNFDVDTVISAKTGEVGGWLDLETDADDNDAWALLLRPFGEIRLNSGKKMWFEARFELGAVADQGFFVGLAEEAALSRDVVADGCAAIIGESVIGFQVLSGDTDAFDAFFALDGTDVTILADANQAAALELANSGESLDADLVADTPRKVGMRFDGKESLFVFVDGVRVATYSINASTFPNNVNLGFVVALKTGTAAAQSAAIDWIQVAYQEQT
jgi:hypothetical protein